MEMIFFILVIILVFISIWEYYSGKLLDLAFIVILARLSELHKKFLRIILAQLFIWIFFLALIFMTYRTLFEIGPGDLRSVRTYFIIFFILIVFPFAVVRKKYASWVKKTVTSNREK
jgi:hypothetical protein